MADPHLPSRTEPRRPPLAAKGRGLLGAILLLLPLSLLLTCAGTKKIDSASLGEALEDRLKDRLAGRYSRMLYPDAAAQPEPDGDLDEEDEWSRDLEAEESGIGTAEESTPDPVCCDSADPCGIGYDAACQCPEEFWDLSDCVVTAQPAGNGRALSLAPGAVCVPISASSVCLPSGEMYAEADSRELTALDLGWFDTEPPPAGHGLPVERCFDDPFLLTPETEPVLTFAFDPRWVDLAALLLTFDEIPGHGRLPIDTCGQVLLPTADEICALASPGKESLFHARAALLNFSGQAGDATTFTLVLRCP